MPRYRDGGELSNEVKFWSNERLDLNEALLAEEYLEVIQHKLAAIRFEKRRRDPSCWMPEYCVFPGWLLWYPEDLSPRARLLCILLNTYRDLYDGVCPHIETLAKQLRVSKWTIVRCIQELRKAGMLRTRRRRGSLVFFLTDALRKAKAKGKIVRVGKNANSELAKTPTLIMTHLPLSSRIATKEGISTEVSTNREVSTKSERKLVLVK